MKSLLLLILSLMTGCEASYEVSEVQTKCPEGWVKLTCKHPNTMHQSTDIVKPKGKPGKRIQGNIKDVRKNNNRFSLYYDTKNTDVRVAIRHLKPEDLWGCTCGLKKSDSSESSSDEVEVEKVGCQNSFIQPAYRTAETTITCDYPGNNYNYNPRVKFLCKQKDLRCEDILSTQSSPKSNGTFTLTETISGFNVSISNVSSQHAGVYWCGVKTNEGSYRAALRKIQLKVNDITTFTRSPTIGQDLTYWCGYPDDALTEKFICKGEDPSICQPLVSTAQLNKKAGKFSMRDDKKKRNITITVREVTTDDTGTYWCGAKSSHKTHSNTFFHRFLMTVAPVPSVPPTTSTPSITSSTSDHPVATSYVTSTESTVASAERFGGSRVTVTIAAVLLVAVLVLVLILVLIYKRFYQSKNTGTGEAQNNKEDRAYEEIQEHHRKPDSGTALKTIYATANLPTNPSSSQNYSNINIQNSSGEVGGDTYSTVRDNDQCPTYSTVNPPTKISEDPFYSTVNMPQQH